MARLGKKERQERRNQWALVKAAKAEIIASNLRHLSEMDTSEGYGRIHAKTSDTVTRANQNMTHGLYRGQYDPDFSSDRQTNRGLAVPKHKSAKAAKASEVRSITIREA